MPHIYKQWIQVIIKVAFYDRIKHAIMPYSSTKYSGLDFFIRSQSAAIMCMGLTTALTYPFDTLHTRLASDVTPMTRKRIYSSTFQCFRVIGIALHLGIALRAQLLLRSSLWHSNVAISKA